MPGIEFVRADLSFMRQAAARQYFLERRFGTVSRVGAHFHAAVLPADIERDMAVSYLSRLRSSLIFAEAAEP